ncbi:Sec-independent protein translocase TatA [Streptomyces luteolifulvus]|uniref:Sec-independent protein translocase protein TatA n=1 Tax=Streptomyces luteolifulvus TaxID=2615112 RepID=A0A6H9V2Q5_9ACTN|nr:twin-arginine translocase TatA/TatE family subunit [Streptomyces luteolifulvus]KAB1148845.1 Sec-independent protein translocase TatA [Streptomyces luteolifulvus]
MFGLSELALILVVVIVVLGIKKLPELTRSAGKAARIFKSEAKALKEQDSPDAPSGSGRVVSGAAAERDEPSSRS